MAENKIPVLTEVYKPNKGKGAATAKAEPLQLTPELIAEIAAQIKPEQKADASSSELDALRAEVKKLRDELTESVTGNKKTASAHTEAAGDAIKALQAEVKTLQEALATATSQADDGVTSEAIDTLRAEQAALREELTTSTKSLLEQTAASSTTDTAEMAQTLSAQVKPRLEAEITDYVLDELRSEIKKAREDIIESTASFVDKTKADLKTEMPKMYQSSIDLAQVNITERFAMLQTEASTETEAALAAVKASLQEVAQQQQALITEHHAELSTTFDVLKNEVQDNLKSAVSAEVTALQEKAMDEHKGQLSEALAGFLQVQGEEAEKTLLRKMQDYQEKLHVDYQEKLTGQVADALETIKERVEESTEEQIGIMHAQVGTIQQETFAKLRQDFDAEKDLVYTAAASEISTDLAEKMQAQSHEISEQFLAKVNGNLPDVQKILQDNVQAILDEVVPDLETRLREELTEEIKQLLLKVKFVLPD